MFNSRSGRRCCNNEEVTKVSDALQFVIESDPKEFINAANLTNPELVFRNEAGELVHYPMPQSFVAFPIADANSELHGVDVVQITDARATHVDA
jgi:hypothetical protein